MNGLALAFLLVSIVALLWLPRRWACVPVIACCLYMPYAQGFDIAGARFTLIRVLILAGIIRVVVRGERTAAGINLIDKLLIAWAIWALLSSLGHEKAFSAFVFRTALVIDCLGIYYLFRVFCGSLDDILLLCKIIAVLLLPVAIEMVFEKLANRNLFSVLGAREFPSIREGRIRAQGPFGHSILAGTVGAACLPLMVGLWNYHRRLAKLGLSVCLIMVIACASSGPVLSAASGIFALFIFRYRDRMRLIRWSVVGVYLLLNMVMKVPAYFLMARIDISGGSTGWHRARLIQSAFQHLGEWWWMGTDRTRHWMPSGVSWNQEHTDITNYYLKMGVWGGLPLMLLFISVLIAAFVQVGKAIRSVSKVSSAQIFMLWAMGASLFTLVTTGISVSFFDQSFVFVYMIIAAISSTHAFENIHKADLPLRRI